ncbi:MAG TPA: septum site-determining protein MinC [Candidatus Binatia bacterium]|nr:septum site-determining protein MinC [Candidatus Binatia bacterium]
MTLSSRPAPAVELKGRMASLTRLRLLTADVAAIQSHLEDLARKNPGAVLGLPVVVESEFAADLPTIWGLLRTVGMQPLGVAEGPLSESGRAMGMPVLPDEGSATPRAKAAPAGGPRLPARIVEAPVRSGQQIYAEGADLIVTGAVSTGAELIADGCVHVYGPMRGRAIAGARGDEKARVFCRKFEAELVAVAGVYAIADQLQGLRKSAAQAFLKDGKLKVELLRD